MLVKISQKFKAKQLLSTSKQSFSRRTAKCDCIKGVRILSFSGPYFPAFGLNTWISVFSPNAGKCESEKRGIWELFTKWWHITKCVILTKLFIVFHKISCDKYLLKTAVPKEEGRWPKFWKQSPSGTELYWLVFCIPYKTHYTFPNFTW